MANDNLLNHEFFNNTENVIKIIEATGELFISLHLFDLQENKLIPIKSNPRIEGLSEKFDTAQDKVTFIMQSLSVPRTLNAIVDFTNLSNLPDRLKHTNMISQLFEGKYLGWCNVRFVKLDNSEPLRYVLCVVQSVDKDIKRIQELKSTVKENNKLHSIVDGLMNEYTTVMTINTNDESIEMLRISERSEYFLGAGNAFSNYKRLVNAYIEYGIHPNDKESARDFLRLENLRRIEEGTSVSLIYRNELGEYGETKLIKTGEHHVIAGFSERNKEIGEMRDKLFTDSLTGVRNRKFYDEEALRSECKGLVMADIDNFKTVNDTYGHQLGDLVITEVAKALKSCLRKSDEVIRYGGDEFVIAFKEITPEALSGLLEKMRRTIESIVIIDHPEIHLSMSFGGVVGNSTVEKMLSSADEAMYISKEKKNCVTITSYNKGMELILRNNKD